MFTRSVILTSAFLIPNSDLAFIKIIIKKKKAVNVQQSMKINPLIPVAVGTTKTLASD